MSTKIMKVYICDYCGKIEPPQVVCGFAGVYKTKPEGWKHICKMDLCSTCAENFTKAMEGKNNESVSE